MLELVIGELGAITYIYEIKDEYKDVEIVYDLGAIHDNKIASNTKYMFHISIDFPWHEYKIYQSSIRRITFVSYPGYYVCKFFNLDLNKDFFQHRVRYQINF